MGRIVLDVEYVLCINQQGEFNFAIRSHRLEGGEAHFKALAVHENPAKFKRAAKVEDLFK